MRVRWKFYLSTILWMRNIFLRGALMTKTLYLMRHGETLFNQLGLIQGWCDSPLTTTGTEQAKPAYDYFETNSISFVDLLWSTAERCSDTLEIVSERKDYARLKGLKEFNFGRMEGKPEYLHPNRKPDQHGHGNFYLQYDGESEEQVMNRVHRTLYGLVAETPEDKTILAVSHAGAIMGFFKSLELLSYPELHLTNCCIFHYQIQQDNFSLQEIIDPVNNKIYENEG